MKKYSLAATIAFGALLSLPTVVRAEESSEHEHERTNVEIREDGRGEKVKEQREYHRRANDEPRSHEHAVKHEHVEEHQEYREEHHEHDAD